MGQTIEEAVEGNDRTGRELAVEDQIERQVHEPADEVPPQPDRVAPPRGDGQHREELVGMQGEDDAPGAALEVVAQEGAGAQITLSFENDVVDGMIDVDEESAGGDRGGQD